MDIILLLMLMVLLGGFILGQLFGSKSEEITPEQLQKLIEAGKLALKIETLQKELESEKIKTEAGIREIHDLLFFKDIPVEQQRFYRQRLESRLNSYQKGADEYPDSADAATAAFYLQLLKDLSLTWPNEVK